MIKNIEHILNCWNYFLPFSMTGELHLQEMFFAYCNLYKFLSCGSHTCILYKFIYAPGCEIMPVMGWIFVHVSYMDNLLVHSYVTSNLSPSIVVLWFCMSPASMLCWGRLLPSASAAPETMHFIPSWGSSQFVACEATISLLEMMMPELWQKRKKGSYKLVSQCVRLSVCDILSENAFFLPCIFLHKKPSPIFLLSFKFF